MNVCIQGFALITCFLLVYEGESQVYEGKYNEGIYKEEDVPEYELPDVLTGFDGQKVTSVEQWEDFRRPEILNFFAQNMYGKVPVPSDPVTKSFELVEEKPDYLEGLCTRKRISITHKNKLGEVSMPMLLFIPNDIKGPVPAIFLYNGDDIRRDRLGIDSPQRYGSTRNGVPLVQLIEKGIALITIDGNAFGRGLGIEGGKVKGGIVNLFFEPGQKYTKEDEWGLIAVWAYAISAGMDYVETDIDIHPEKVAVLGCSVNGKVALWAAANDTRISMVLSATTGHGGDAIWRRQFGETLENMCTYLPSWICRNACKYANDVNSLPVDQHTLLATLAPRPLYIGTAELDLWADQKGQWIATYHAAPVYRLYGEEVTFSSSEQPALNSPIIESAIGYYVRSGYHGLTYYDWERYIEFIEYHFINPVDK